jgi:hypothetical protein
MMAYAALGLIGLVVLYLLARAFLAASPRDLARALKAFGAAFAALASTGLLFTGRLGLALVTLAATAVAVRALVQGPRGADPLAGGGGDPGPGSSVDTDLLAMRLDHATGEVEGRVKRGAFAGRELGTLGQGSLLQLLEEARREDPPSQPLLEAYLDRRFPDWRDSAAGGDGADAAGPPPGAAPAGMDERTALEILGLPAGAGEAEIKAAHRQLMARLHPDHGGSSYLAAQLNRARDHLLRRKR